MTAVTSCKPASMSCEIARTHYGQIFQAIDNVDQQLQALNKLIHDNPELCYKEFKAHDNITLFLQSQGLVTISHAFGLETSFLAEYGEGGRLVTFCAEYDALEGIGHACGHNLIATSSIAAFLGVVSALKVTKASGRVRLLGCPAEEGGGGKLKLIDAGAFAGVDAALMIHPTTPVTNRSLSLAGISYGTGMSACGFTVKFTGKAAHAGVTPWLGVNALDAATLSYTAVSMLRQQAEPTNRINIVIREGGFSPNVITNEAIVVMCIRSSTMKEMTALTERVYKCFEGAAVASGCTVQIIKQMEPYAELRPNESLCFEFAETMNREFSREYYCNLEEKDFSGYATDMGNVSYECPSFHGNFAIPVLPGDTLHGPGFARAAGTLEAHQTATQAAKGMAATGWRVLFDEGFAEQVHANFEEDKLKR